MHTQPQTMTMTLHQAYASSAYVVTGSPEPMVLQVGVRIKGSLQNSEKIYV